MRGWYRRSKGIVLAAIGVLVALMGVSYLRALLAPNSPGWDLRTAEWMRDTHLGWALDLAEHVWLSVRKPSAEELQANQLTRLPAPFARARAEFPRPAAPPSITPVFARSLPGEGEWLEIGSTVNGVPALRSTFFRPDTRCPEASVAVARFTPGLTRFVLVPGTRDPGGEWRWHGGIPEDQYKDLLAAFNAGFRLRDAHGGIYVEGQVARPLVDGAASIVIDQSGGLDVVEWTPEAMTPAVAAVRQNLGMLVNRGKVRKGLGRVICANGLARSGLGIAEDGAVIYVTGHGLDEALLAKALQLAGARRAMHLDLHTQWQSFNVFQPGAGAGPKVIANKLTTIMRLPATRYLTPDDRDFLAAFVR